MDVVFHHIGNPRNRITAQNAATTLNRVRIALGFSGGGKLDAEAVEVKVVCEDPWSSYFSLMIGRTCFIWASYMPGPLQDVEWIGRCGG